MSRCWRAECTIDAPVEAVWAVLVDFEAYPAWNPFTREVHADLALGAPVRMRVDMGGLGVIRQTEYVRAVERGARIAWAMDGWPRWLLHARRDQTLTALPDGRTRYVTEDVISGLLLRVVAAIFGGPMQRGFDGVAASLAAEVARRTSD